MKTDNLQADNERRGALDANQIERLGAIVRYYTENPGRLDYGNNLRFYTEARRQLTEGLTREAASFSRTK